MRGSGWATVYNGRGGKVLQDGLWYGQQARVDSRWVRRAAIVSTYHSSPVATAASRSIPLAAATLSFPTAAAEAQS